MRREYVSEFICGTHACIVRIPDTILFRHVAMMVLVTKGAVTLFRQICARRHDPQTRGGASACRNLVMARLPVLRGSLPFYFGTPI